MKWLTAEGAFLALATGLVDLVGKYQALEVRAELAELDAARAAVTVEDSRESCGDAVGQLARFAAECSARCMGSER